jgi:hypothetical protein
MCKSVPSRQLADTYRLLNRQAAGAATWGKRTDAIGIVVVALLVHFLP